MQRIEHSWSLIMGEIFVCQLVGWVGILLCREATGTRLQKLLWFELAEVKIKMFCLRNRICVILSHIFQHSSDGGHRGKCRPLQAVFNRYSRNQRNPPLISLGASRCIYQFCLIRCCFWLSPIKPWILNAFLCKMHLLFQNISLPRMKLQVQ